MCVSGGWSVGSDWPSVCLSVCLVQEIVSVQHTAVQCLGVCSPGRSKYRTRLFRPWCIIFSRDVKTESPLPLAICSFDSFKTCIYLWILLVKYPMRFGYQVCGKLTCKIEFDWFLNACIRTPPITTFQVMWPFATLNNLGFMRLRLTLRLIQGHPTLQQLLNLINSFKLSFNIHKFEWLSEF